MMPPVYWQKGRAQLPGKRHLLPKPLDMRKCMRQSGKIPALRLPIKQRLQLKLESGKLDILPTSNQGKNRQNRNPPAFRNPRQKNPPQSFGTMGRLPPRRHRKRTNLTRQVIFIRSSETKSSLPRLPKRAAKLPKIQQKPYLPLPSGSARQSSVSFSPISGHCMHLLRHFCLCSY